MDTEKLKSIIKNVFESYGYLENEQDFKTHLAHRLLNHGYSITAEHAYETLQNTNPEHVDLVTWNSSGYIQDIIEVKYKIDSQIDRRRNEVSNSNESSADEFKKDVHRIWTFVKHSENRPSGFVIYITDNVNWRDEIINLDGKFIDLFTWVARNYTTKVGELFYLVIGKY